MHKLFENWRGYLKEDVEPKNNGLIYSRFAAVGDSITVGVGAGHKSYIDYLNGQKFAIGGKASYSLFGKFEEALSTKPEYIIIFMGINNPLSVKGCGENWASQLTSDLSSMYSKAKNKGIKVIGVTLIPAMKIWRSHYRKCPPKLTKKPKGVFCCSSPERRENRNPKIILNKILEVNDFILSNADIAIDNSDMWNHEGLLPQYDADGIHLNGAGQSYLANKIESFIN